MEEIYCSLCAVQLNEGTAVYGLTSGSINNACHGFRVDEDTDWDVYCTDCMNEIDRFLASSRKGNS